MANEHNLIPLNQRSKEQAKEIQRKGGEARGRQRAEMKTAQQFAQAFMNAIVKDNNGNELVFKDALIKKLGKNAFDTLDLPTIKYLFELIGEAPAQKVDVTSEGKSLAPYEGLSKAEIIKRINQLQANRKKK